MLGGVGAHRRRDQEGGVGDQAEGEGEDGEGLGVAPVQVVEHEHRRSPGPEERAGQALEEAVALPRLDHRSPGTLGPRLALGHQSFDLDPPDRVERRPGRADRLGPQPFRDRGQGEAAGGTEALGARDDAPSRRAASASSATRRVFPTPGSPRTTRADGRPAAAARHRALTVSSSCARPTSVPGAAPERPPPGVGERGTGGSSRASRRSRSARVAGAGVTPSSRSRVAAQWW